MRALDFLIGSLGQLYVFVVLLRFALQWSRADFYNPISQFAIKMTNPVLLPLRRIIPGWRGYDWASIVLAMLLVMILVCIKSLLLLKGMLLPWTYILLLTVINTVLLFIKLYFWLIIIEVILSWVNPQALYASTGAIIRQLTQPLMQPIRKRLPMSGIDFSPMIVLLLMHTAELLLMEMLNPSLMMQAFLY